MKNYIILLLFALGLLQSKAQTIDTTSGLAVYDSTDYDFAQFALTSCIGFVKVC